MDRNGDKEMKNKTKDLKFYKRKLDITIQNISGLLGFVFMGWLSYKTGDVLETFNGLTIIIVIMGLFASFDFSIGFFQWIIKLFVFGKKLK